jgi:hypothetical protein
VAQYLVIEHPEALLTKTTDGSLPVEVARLNQKHLDVAVLLEAAMYDEEEPNLSSPEGCGRPTRKKADPTCQIFKRVAKAVLLTGSFSDWAPL